jgi:dTDP-4-amino-4,6-dideoxygalactose transaminase
VENSRPIAKATVDRSVRVPFVDLTTQNITLGSQLSSAIHSVIDRGDFILGNAVREFEALFARYIGVDHAIGVASGLDALQLTLVALGIGAGDEVLLPANTFIATALAVSRTGAIPVLVDCNPHTHNIDTHGLSAAITERTRAIIPVHLQGHPADMDGILSFAGRHALAVVEDACQAHGAVYNRCRCGSLGNAGCFSFYPAKNLGAFGDGGLVTTNDSDLAALIRSLRDYGQSAKYQHDLPGGNSRLDTLQASVLQVKLNYLDQWNASRSSHAHAYREQLQGVGDIVFPQLLENTTSVWHLMVFETSLRNELASFLREQGIATGIHYPIPIHRQRVFKNLGYKIGDFPVTERLAEQIISMPMYPELSVSQRDRVVEAVRDFYR